MSEEKKFLDSAGLKKAFDLIKQTIAEKYISKAEGIDQIAKVFGYTPANPEDVTAEIGAAQKAVEDQLAADKEELEGKISAADAKADGIAEDVAALESKVDKAVEDLEGTVADEIAKIVNENNNGSIDTLNEIASWIINDTTGAAKMAADIEALKDAVGEDGSVAEQIKTAVDAEAEVARAAEEALQDAIDAEAERAEAKEAELDEAVKAEQARAEKAEAELQAEYDSIKRITEAEIVAIFNGDSAAVVKADGTFATYADIAEAITNAETGDTITLVEDIEIPAEAEIADGVTIVANGRVIVC